MTFFIALTLAIVSLLLRIQGVWAWVLTYCAINCHRSPCVPGGYTLLAALLTTASSSGVQSLGGLDACAIAWARQALMRKSTSLGERPGTFLAICTQRLSTLAGTEAMAASS
eukprot:TRINITY_DN6994_c0_g1_i2.p3 TRINITY_DN6994_c0_g1~~TRINITY_DN6994_c0_g1_i2.p3  ORF type:complete len:112 (-),score=8.83 TRINITY_DN6994_c0_g1_i2:127-462(-)